MSGFDEFDKAFDDIGITVEDGTDTAERLGINDKDSKKEVNVSTGFGFAEITELDRIQAVKESLIPRAFKDAKFDIDRIRLNIKNENKRNNKIYTVYNFNNYANLCSNILNTIRFRKLPDKSYIIGAPNGFGKTSFVTECLILLRKNGYRVAPYISLWELAQLRIDNEHRIMNPYRKFKKEGEDVVYLEPNESDAYLKKPTVITNGYSYSEYINADCLFVHLTDLVSKDIESHTLYQLLGIRGAKGLPTIVMIPHALSPYENDQSLKQYVWDEIRNYDEKNNCYDKLLHVSCYKRKTIGMVSGQAGDSGIVD